MVENVNINIVVAVALVINTCGITLAYLLVRKYVETRSRTLLFMLLPMLGIIGTIMNMSLSVLYSLTAVEGMTTWDRPLSLILAGTVCAAGTPITGVVFTQQVFRPRARWAKGVVVILISVIAIVFVWPYFMEGAIDARPALASTATKWIAMGSALAIWAWAAFESFSLYRDYKADLNAGKPLDALVVNRFALWGGMALGMFLSYLPFI